jgi:cation transport regulator ChaC
MEGVRRRGSSVHLYLSTVMCVSPMSKWIFSYGSNSVVQLRGRVQNPTLQAYPAHVDGWDRIFCFWSSTWKGAAASLEPSESRTYGSAVNLSEREIELLDRYETNYELTPLNINVYLNSEEVVLQGYAYIANDKIWSGPPSEQYLTAIHLMLREQWGSSNSCLQILVKGVFEDNPSVRHIHTWTHPGSHAISLPALCVEVNSRRSTPWVMPQTIHEIVHKLSLVGIHSSAQLAVHLTSQERMDALNENITRQGCISFQIDTLKLFRDALGI